MRKISLELFDFKNELINKNILIAPKNKQVEVYYKSIKDRTSPKEKLEVS